jgi:hypothetical protein
MKYLLFLLPAFMAFACSNPEKQAHDTALANLKLSLENSDNFELLKVAPVDSAFGLNYFTKQELNHIFKSTSAGTQKVIKYTKKFSNIEDMPPAAIAAVQRQMQSNNAVRELFLHPMRKGDFSGYKVKITYQATDARGNKFVAERWNFVDPEGKQVLRTFEIPIP